jgi:hypothetical protein
MVVRADVAYVTSPYGLPAIEQGDITFTRTSHLYGTSLDELDFYLTAIPASVPVNETVGYGLSQVNVILASFSIPGRKLARNFEGDVR